MVLQIFSVDLEPQRFESPACVNVLLSEVTDFSPETCCSISFGLDIHDLSQP